MRWRFCLILILTLAAFLRLYNLSGNFTIDGDGGRDVMIAQEAIHRGEIPLTGAFTSAGPFVFGPLFYWFVIGANLILPLGLVTPWVLMFVVGVCFVGLMMIMANEIGGKKLAVIVGLLAASSPQMVARSRVLTQHTLVAITAALAMYFFILLWKKQKAVFSFLMGISLGVAVSLHYQAINLLLFLPSILLIPKVNWRTKIIYFVLGIVGFLLPSLPLLVWDSKQNFANINNILDFLLIGQYRLYVPASWKLFLFTQFPGYFAYVTGGIQPAGLLLFFASTIWLIRARGVIFVLAMIYFVLMFLNRYYRGERFEGYLIYFVPFILLFTGILFEKIFSVSKIFKVVGVIVFGAVLVLNIWTVTTVLVNTPTNLISIRKFVQSTSKKYNNQKLAIYQNNPNSVYVAYPIYLTLLDKGLIDQKNGVPLGVILDSSESGYHLVDLRESEKDLAFGERKLVSREEVYDDLIGWLQKNQLRSSFSLIKYLQEKLP